MPDESVSWRYPGPSALSDHRPPGWRPPSPTDQPERAGRQPRPPCGRADHHGRLSGQPAPVARSELSQARGHLHRRGRGPRGRASPAPACPASKSAARTQTLGGATVHDPTATPPAHVDVDAATRGTRPTARRADPLGAGSANRRRARDRRTRNPRTGKDNRAATGAAPRQHRPADSHAHEARASRARTRPRPDQSGHTTAGGRETDADGRRTGAHRGHRESATEAARETQTPTDEEGGRLTLWRFRPNLSPSNGRSVLTISISPPTAF